MGNQGKSKIEEQLTTEFGPLIGGADLWKTMGFKSQGAFKRAQRNGLLGIKVFEIQNRKGLFALTHELAAWIDLVSGQKAEDE